MSKNGMTYGQVTGRPVSVKVADFLDRLEERFSEDRVTAAILAEGHKGDFGKILGRVSDRLSLEDTRAVARQQPFVELEGAALLAVVRGKKPAPQPPFTYSSRGLTADEYGEVLLWSQKRRDAA